LERVWCHAKDVGPEDVVIVQILVFFGERCRVGDVLAVGIRLELCGAY
jgi:hypothetical protein